VRHLQPHTQHWAPGSVAVETWESSASFHSHTITRVAIISVHTNRVKPTATPKKLSRYLQQTRKEHDKLVVRRIVGNNLSQPPTLHSRNENHLHPSTYAHIKQTLITHNHNKNAPRRLDTSDHINIGNPPLTREDDPMRPLNNRSSRSQNRSAQSRSSLRHGSQLGVPVETLDDQPYKCYDDHLKLPICEPNPDPILDE